MGSMMKDLPENELLSAYLDGELTAEEQARVEQLLAQNAAARQLLDELRALSATLQSLPARKLEEGLSGDVLRIAERRMLAESPEPGQAAEPSPGETTAETPLWRMIVRRALQPRNLLWPAIAVAAAILIMVMNPDRRQGEKDLAERRVAMAPKEAPPAGGESFIGPLTGARDEAAEGLGREGALRRSAVAETPKVDGTMGLAAKARSSNGVAAGQDQPAAPPASPARGMGAARYAATERAREGGGESAPRVVEKRLEKSGDTADAKRAPAPSAGAVPGVAKASVAQPSPVPPGSMADQMKVPGSAREEERVGDLKAGKDFFKEGEAGAAQSLRSAEPMAKRSEEPLVVLCEVTPEAVREHAFERIVDFLDLGEARRTDKKVKAGGERYVEVELTPVQVDVVLAKLESKPSLFPRVVRGAAMPGDFRGKEEGQPVVGKGDGTTHDAVRLQTIQGVEGKVIQERQQNAPATTPGGTQPGFQYKSPGMGMPSAYGAAASQSRTPGGGGTGTDQSGRGAAGATTGQFRMQRAAPGGQAAGAMAVPQGVQAGPMAAPQAPQAAPPAVQMEQAPAYPAVVGAAPGEKQSPAQPYGGGFGGARGAGGAAMGLGGMAPEAKQAMPGMGARAAPMMLKAVKAKAASPAAPQPATESLSQQLDQGLAKRRVLFVLRLAAEGGPTDATIATEEQAGKAEAAKAAARAVQAKPAQAPAGQPAAEPAKQ